VRWPPSAAQLHGRFPVCSFHEDSITFEMQEKELSPPSSQAHTHRRASSPAVASIQPVAPTLASMRPDSPHDPTVELIEELSDVGSFVVLTPPPHSGLSLSISSLVFRGTRRFVRLPNLVPETSDRLITRIRVERTRTCLATNLALG